MDRLGIGQVDLAEHLHAVRRFPAVKVQRQPFAPGVDLRDAAYVAVEHSGTHGAVILLPDHIVVIPGLHDPVPYPEHPLAPQDLPLAGGLGVQGLLQKPVQIHGAAGTLSGGGQHLDLVRRDVHIVRQAGAAQLQHRGHRPLGVPAAEEEEIPLVPFQFRGFSQVHPVGVADDGGLLRLPEHLPEKHRFDLLAADQVGKHVARPHGGQLVRVSHQHQPGAGPQCPQQCGEQGHVHHAHLVHDDSLRLQGLLLRFLEGHLMAGLVPGHAQQPVDRLGLHARQLAHPLRRPARGGRQHDVQPHFLEQGHNAPDGGGLAGAGAAGQEDDAGLRRQLHRLPLQGGVGDALLLLDLRHGPVRVPALVRVHVQQHHQPGAGGGLRLPQPPQIHRLHIGNPLDHHSMALRQGVQGRFHLLHPTAQQLAGGVQQLVLGQEHMAVIFVVGQFKGHRRPEPLAAVLRKAHGQGHGVRHGKIHAAHVVRQQVGVPAHHFQGAVPVLLPQPDGQHWRQLIPGQKFHQPPQPHVLAEQRPDLHGLLGGDAPDLLKPLRLRFQDVQRLQAKPVHDPPGSGGPHPLADAGGEVIVNLVFLLRQAPLQFLDLQLLAVLGMGLPGAGDGQMFPRCHAGDAPHNRNDLPLLCEEAEDRISIFRVLKNDAMYRALPADQFFHGPPSSAC